MPADALRNTLDHLALDPNAGTDRHYLVTMLRRLGYSEQEIQQALGDAGEEGRVIEVEYSGPGGTQYTFVKEGQATAQFTLADGDNATFTLAGDPAAGTEEFSTIDLEDVDVSDDWGDDWNDDEKPEDFAETEDDAAFEQDEELVEFTESKKELVAFNAEADDPAIAAGWEEVGDDAWEEIEGPAEPATPGERRVRVLRIQADSKQDAEEYAREQGFNVRGSATLRVEQDDEVDTQWDIEHPPGHPIAETSESFDEVEAPEWANVDTEPEWVAEPDEPRDAAEPTEAAPDEPTWTAEPDEPAWEADASDDEADDMAWPEHKAPASFDDVAPVPEAPPEFAEIHADDVAWNDGQPTEAATPSSDEAYTHGDYTLYTRQLKLTTGRTQDLYFFAKHAPKAGHPCSFPEGYEVTESEKTGQPFLRKAE